jgi:flagella basal body P-ring formation protein FlgA
MQQLTSLSTMKHLISLAIACSSLIACAEAAEVVLQPQAAPQAPIVRLGDVALVSADDSLAAKQLMSTPLMPAPAEGSVKYLRATELHDILVARGVDTRGIQFSGAEVVAIGEPAAQAGQSGNPAAEAGVAATPEQVAAAIAEYLCQQSGHDLWNVQIEADKSVLDAFSQAGGHVGISGGKAPWSGRQRFLIAGAAGAQPVMVYARVDRMEMAVVVIRPIERGQLVRRSDVELRPHLGAVPKQAMFSLDSAVGKEAVQGLRADSLLLANQVRSPLLVRRGDRVSVRVRAGGVTVRAFAVAQQDGSAGDLVALQNAEGKERYTAVVRGLRELEVFAAGASAVDIAAAAPREIR